MSKDSILMTGLPIDGEKVFLFFIFHNSVNDGEMTTNLFYFFECSCKDGRCLFSTSFGGSSLPTWTRRGKRDLRVELKQLVFPVFLRVFSLLILFTFEILTSKRYPCLFFFRKIRQQQKHKLPKNEDGDKK
jgi:hypothetical protein